MQGKLRTFKTNSQNSKILAYLKTGKTLTVAQGRKLGFGDNTRSRISEIKEAGYPIESKQVKFDGGFIARYNMSRSWFLEQIGVCHVVFKDKDNNYAFDKNGNLEYLARVVKDLENGFTAVLF